MISLLRLNIICTVIMSLSVNLFGQTKISSDSLYQMSIEELMGIDVSTVTKFQRDIKTLPDFVTIINSEQIKNMGARTIEDVLKIVPGFNSTINQFGLKEFEIRGFTSTNSATIKFLIDGISINNNVFGEATRVFDDMSLDGVERVEIIRGPGSAIHGSNAMLSVVNIITDKSTNKDELNIKLKGGSYSTYESSIEFQKIISEDFKVWGTLNYLKTEGPELLIEKDRISDYPFSLAPGFTDYTNEKIDIRFSMLYKDWKFNSIFVNKSRGPFIGPSYALVERGEFKNNEKYFLANMEHNRQLNKDLLLKYKLYFKRMYFSPDGQIFPPGFAELNSNGTPQDINNDGVADVFPDGMIATYELNDNSVGTEILSQWKIHTDHELIGGLIFEYDWLSDLQTHANFNIFVPSPPYKLDGIGWFEAGIVKPSERFFAAFNIMDSWTIIPDGIFEFGFRYDYYNDFGSAISPRVAINYKISDLFILKSLYAKSFRAPSFGELARTNNPNIEGNPNLEPEEVNTFEIGFEANLNKVLKTSAVFFYVELNNQIVRAQKDFVVPGYPALFYDNRSNSRSMGIEVEISSYINKIFSGFINYTYQKSESDINNNGNLITTPNIPNHKANFVLNILPISNVNFSLTLNYIGKRSRSEVDLRGPIESYLFASSTIVLSEIFKNFSLSGSVYNIFDSNYFDSGHAKFIPNDYPRPGRNFLLRVNYSLGEM